MHQAWDNRPSLGEHTSRQKACDSHKLAQGHASREKEKEKAQETASSLVRLAPAQIWCKRVL